jgi:hypothetical protein
VHGGPTRLSLCRGSILQPRNALFSAADKNGFRDVWIGLMGPVIQKVGDAVAIPFRLRWADSERRQGLENAQPADESPAMHDAKRFTIVAYDIWRGS